MMVMSVFVFKNNFKDIIVIAIVLSLVVLFIGIGTQYGQFILSMYEEKFVLQSNVNHNPRYIAMVICLREFLHSPIWGIGLGNHIALINWELSGWSGGGNAHSVFSVPADLGVLGAVPFFLFWLILYARTVKSVVFLQTRYSSLSHFYLTVLSAGLSVFVLARLFLYFHSLADEAFIIWPVIFYTAHGVIAGNAKRTIHQESPIKLPQADGNVGE